MATTSQRKLFRITLSTCVVLTLLLSHPTGAYRILALALMVTPSHKITFEPLLDELAGRGHEVTVISPIPPKKAVRNLREIHTFPLSDFLEMPNIFDMKEHGEKVSPIKILTSYSEVCMAGLQSPQLQALQNETFDLIFLPIMFNECGAAWASTVFDAPIILLSIVSAPPYMTTLYGNPSPPSFIPFIFLGYRQSMNFYQRTVSVLTEAFLRTTVYNFVFPGMELRYRQILNDSTIPSVEELIIKKTSLILSNSHFSISQHRPFLPDIIEVGGMHCRDAQPLPKVGKESNKKT